MVVCMCVGTWILVGVELEQLQPVRALDVVAVAVARHAELLVVVDEHARGEPPCGR